MNSNVVIVNDADRAIALMYDVCVWMDKAGLVNSEWWQPKNMNKEFMFKQAEPDEFFVAIVNGEPAAPVILQDNERNQSWHYIDKNLPQKALYIHWLAVNRKFAGQGLPKFLIDFAITQAKDKQLKLLRLDTEAHQPKLMNLYKNIGFNLMGVENKETAYFQMEI